MKDGLPIIVLAVAIVAAIILVFVVDAWLLKRRAKKEESERKKEEEAEAARIAALPRVEKIWLLQSPGGAGMGPKKGLYGSRYHRLLIMDPDGSTWVGLATPEVLESLKECGYSPYGFWIPFCGPGESRRGRPVEVDGLKIEVYPDWLVPGEDPEIWQQWAAIEKKFQEAERNGWDYQEGLSKLRKAIEARNQ